MYDQQIKEIYERCDSIKATIKKELRALVYYEVLEVLTPKRSFLLPIVQENDLEDLRKTMEKQTKELADGRIQRVFHHVFIVFSSCFGRSKRSVRRRSRRIRPSGRRSSTSAP